MHTHSNHTLETYSSLCTEYYELDKPHPPQDSYDFFRSYLQEANGPILEPMCGTGRFLIPFALAGFAVDGFDASTHMLAKLHQKCQTHHITPHVSQSFIQDMHCEKHYALIYITCGSFNLITDLDHVKSSLKKIHQHLLPNGRFVCEFETLNFISSHFATKTASSKILPNQNKLTFTLIPRPFQNNIDSMICHYALTKDNQLLQEETELFQVRLYPHDDLHALLKEAGFSTIHTHKAFNRNQNPDPSDLTVIYECHK